MGIFTNEILLINKLGEQAISVVLMGINLLPKAG
jgi:hypothetical protein